MNFTCINKLLVFTNIVTKVGNHKSGDFVKTRQNICGPFKYGLNTVNNQDTNLPRW